MDIIDKIETIAAILIMIWIIWVVGNIITTHHKKVECPVKGVYEYPFVLNKDYTVLKTTYPLTETTLKDIYLKKRLGIPIFIGNAN